MSIFFRKKLKVSAENNDNSEIKENKDILVSHPKEDENKDILVNHPKEEDKIINTIIKKQQLDLITFDSNIIPPDNFIKQNEKYRYENKFLYLINHENLNNNEVEEIEIWKDGNCY